MSSLQYDLGMFFSEGELTAFKAVTSSAPQMNASSSSSSLSSDQKSETERRRDHWRHASVSPTPQPTAAQDTYGRSSQPAARRPSVPDSGRRPSVLSAVQSSGAHAARGQRLEPLTSTFTSQENSGHAMSQVAGNGMSAFNPTTATAMQGNAFGDYMRRLPSVNYGAQSFHRNGADNPQSFALTNGTSQGFQSMFRGMPSQMQMSGAAPSTMAAPYSLIAPLSGHEQSTMGTSQFGGHSLQDGSHMNLGSLGHAMGTGASQFSTASISLSSEMPASFGLSGMGSASDEYTGASFTRGAAGSPKIRRTSKPVLAETRPAVGKHETATTAPSRSASRKPPDPMAAGTLSTKTRTRGARMDMAPATTDKVDLRKAFVANDDDDEDDDTANTSDSLYFLLPRRSSKTRDKLFLPINGARYDQDREHRRQSLLRARRMAPGVWQRLLRDPMSVKKTQPRRSYTVEGEDEESDEEEEDVDPDQWNGLPMRRRSLNELLGPGAGGARPTPPSTDDRNVFVRGNAGARFDQSSGAASPSELQMSGLQPRHFIDYTPTCPVPQPQPSMSGPKHSSFEPNATSIARSPYRWALEDATVVDSPRNSRGQSILDDD